MTINGPFNKLMPRSHAALLERSKKMGIAWGFFFEQEGKT